MSRPAPWSALAVTVVIGFAVAGCGSRGTDKAGGQHAAPSKPVVLVLANYNFAPVELAPFAREVLRRSHGAIRIVVRSHWRDGQSHVETRLIHDVLAGHADMGWVGTREWDTFGVTAFDALHLPFVLDSYALEQAVLESPLPAAMLRELKTVGLVGIGILPGELRRVVGVRKPIVRREDFRGLTFGTTQARAALATIRALGAKPVPFLVLPSIRGFGGFDFPITSFEGNDYNVDAHFLTTNLALWPRPLVVFMNPKVYARLSPSQRALLAGAARAVVPEVVKLVEDRESIAMKALCEQDRTEFVQATAGDLARLRSAVGPVIQSVDEETHRYLGEIDVIKRRLAAPPQTAPTCPPLARAAGAIPDGTYESTMTAADVKRARVPAQDVNHADLPTRHRLVIRGRTFVVYATPAGGRTNADMEGTYSVYRGKVRFSMTGETLLPFSWSFDGHTLRFFDLPFNGTGYYAALFSPPWTKTR